MTNYNDGEWHGWNGGECPVHLKSIVEIVWRHKDGSLMGNIPAWAAGECAFLGNEHGDIIVFRVVKEYREPQEWWAVGKHLHETEADAMAFKADLARDYGPHHATTPIIHVREVLADAKAVA